MSVPLVHLVIDSRSKNTPEARRMRDIENHYHIERIAENSQQIVDFQTHALRVQGEAAKFQLRAMGELGERLDDIGDGIREGFSQLNASIGSLAETVNDGFAETVDAINQQSEVMQQGFEALGKQMLAQNKVLTEIAQTLRKPYETKMLELRQQADKWLVQGMRNTGRERDDDYKDAMQLLREVTKNPIGNQDYATWFEIGWLLWKYEVKIPEAEEAFYRAMRLSAPAANLYHSLSVRHLAYMQYLQEKHEEAYQTMRRIVDSTTDPFAIFDAARTAAKTGRKDEALKLLDKCVDLDPTFIVRMCAEFDFQ